MPKTRTVVVNGICTVRFGGNYGARCERPLGHTGMHWANYGVLRWGGRYTPTELNGKPGAMKDAARDQAARRRRPRGQRCSVCCQPREQGELKAGQCIDKIACAEFQPYLFGSDDS